MERFSVVAVVVSVVMISIRVVGAATEIGRLWVGIAKSDRLRQFRSGGRGGRSWRAGRRLGRRRRRIRGRGRRSCGWIPGNARWFRRRFRFRFRGGKAKRLLRGSRGRGGSQAEHFWKSDPD